MPTFRTKIYKTGINTCVDVPEAITKKMTPTKGRIHVKGTVNGFAFTKTLVPVKGKPFRLFVNAATLKGAETGPGETARFSIQQELNKVEKHYAMPSTLRKELLKQKVLKNFESLTPARKKDILKYLSYVTKVETLLKHTRKIIEKLKAGEKNVRIP